MKKLGILVGDNGDWKFFNEIFEHLDNHYQTIVHRQKSYNTPLLHGRLNRWTYLNGIRSTLRQSDVCFFEWASELLVEASQMPKYSPIVTRLHSYELYTWAPKVDWDKVDKVILVSKAMQEKFNLTYPDHSFKTAVVYNGTPLNKFKPVHRDFRFNLGMLCSINPRKRIYEVILMLRDLTNKGYEASLHIAGRRLHGPDLDEYYVSIQRLVDKLGLQSNVVFYDHVSDASDWLKEIDIFVSNSYWEGNQVALIEAMATGCYCLSHFWDGAEELLPLENVFSNEGELQQKIITYANLSDSEREKHQALIRELAREKFNITNTKEEICRIVDEAATTSG